MHHDYLIVLKCLLLKSKRKIEENFYKFDGESQLSGCRSSPISPRFETLFLPTRNTFFRPKTIVFLLHLVQHVCNKLSGNLLNVSAIK